LQAGIFHEVSRKEMADLLKEFSMSIDVLVLGNDLNAHRLIFDILEMTFKNITIERATTIQIMFHKLDERRDYDLIILDCQNSKKDDEKIISRLRDEYPDLIDRIIVVFDSWEEKPDDAVMKDIPYIIKPFCLDTFEDIVKRTCSVKR
jgi:DNA-binding NtrC family response regulator